MGEISKVVWLSENKNQYSILDQSYPSHCNFVHHKSYMTCSGIKPGPPQWEDGDHLPKPGGSGEMPTNVQGTLLLKRNCVN
jgi:hypothetical protein